MPWTAVDTPEFCGPEHLARAIQMFRRWDSAEASEGSVSNDGLQRVMELAFRVSLATEEGRHPRFALFVAAPVSEDHVELVTNFHPPIKLTPEVLRRLVPSVPADHALRVIEKDEQLFADGVMAVRDANDVPQLGRPAVSFGLGLPGLTAHVDGPGQVRATEKGLTWELRNGHVKPVSHYAVLSVVQDWFNMMALDLVRRFREEAGSEALREREALGDPALVFDSVWSNILAHTIAEGHGGAFAVLPDESTTSVTIKYGAADLDLSNSVRAYWHACFDSGRLTDAAQLERKTANWESSRRRMYSAARALANLANVDGCVVLNNRLKVLGFGGEIRVPEESVRNSICVEADHRTMSVRAEVDMQQFGTRHRSAYRLCARRPGTIVFVISQDRDLRVFYGRRDKPGEVCLWRSLGAWMAGQV